MQIHTKIHLTLHIQYLSSLRNRQSLMLKANINDQSLDYTQEQIDQLDMIYDANAGQYHILKEGKSHRAQLSHNPNNPKAITILLNGTEHTVTIKDAVDQKVDEMGLSIIEDPTAGDIMAPMPGLILEIMVAAGDTVIKGDSLLILEAMKMENVIKAEADGIVKSVSLSKGDTVEKNQLIIEMEADA